MPVTQLMTAEDLWKLPRNGNTYDLVRGELRTVSPAGFEHGFVGNKLGYYLTHFVLTHELGVVLGAETGFLLEQNPDTVRGPDNAFVGKERFEKIGMTPKYFPAAPDLAVEIVSPHDSFEEVEEKVNQYLSAGTSLVWVVVPKTKRVYIYHMDKPVVVLSKNDVLDGLDVVPAFQTQVGQIFS